MYIVVYTMTLQAKFSFFLFLVTPRKNTVYVKYLANFKENLSFDFHENIENSLK